MQSRSKIKRSLIANSIRALTIPLGVTGYTGLVQAQVLEEIVVTATRRAESVQDIPLNIAAIGAGQIDKQGFGDISELMSFVPGVNIADQGGRDGNRIVVRGLNADPVENTFGQENGGGTVATYVGEVPLFVDLRLNDLQRVEVLLGPQGTLYGAGTMGGAIRYIPNKPNFEQSEFEVRADAYSYGEGDGFSTDLGFTFNAPVSDTFAIRGSIDSLDDDGFIDYPYVVSQIGVSNPDPDFSNPADRAANFSPVEDANTEEILSGRLAARWQASDAIDATLTYYFQNGEYGGRNTSSLRSQVPSGEYEFSGRVVEPNNRDSELIALEIVADLGFAELTSATGIASVEENGQRDQTDLLISLEYSYETFPTFTAFTAEDEETDIFNQEIRLVSQSDGPLSWIVGAFYNKNEYNALSSEFTPGYGLFTGFGDQLNDLEYFEVDRTTLEEKAIFGEIAYQISDNWDVTVGARFYEYDYDTANLTEFPYFADPSFRPFPLSEIEGQLTLTPNQSFEDELFKVNSSYKFENGNLIYATLSQGFRVGASNGGEACPDVFVAGPQGLCLLSPGQQFGPNPGEVSQVNELEFLPDTVDNYEIGIKTTMLDGALNLNAAIFMMDWKDPQVASASVNAGTAITINGGSAETKGFELSSNWQVSENLRLSGNLSYSDAELTEDVPSLVRTISTPGFGTSFEDGRSGDQLPGSPKSQFSFFAEYEHPLNNGASLLFNGAYAWQDEVLSFAGGRGGSFTLPSFGRANVALGYHTDNWSVTGYVDNLFDDFSESSAANTPLFNQNILGANVRRFRTNVLPPRTLGVRLKYNFK